MSILPCRVAKAESTSGQVFLKLGQPGSTLAGAMDALSTAISISPQNGVRWRPKRSVLSKAGWFAEPSCEAP